MQQFEKLINALTYVNDKRIVNTCRKLDNGEPESGVHIYCSF
jgi:hypothetical protein